VKKFGDFNGVFLSIFEFEFADQENFLCDFLVSDRKFKILQLESVKNLILFE
jgi:hypothetical protein